MDNYVITIGRQFGSGGRGLGEILSKKLNIPFYDKELLMQAATQSGLNPDFLINNDERLPKFINSALSFTFGMSAMPWYAGSSSISDDNLYKTTSDFIYDIAQRGSCIIVGRSADYVLRDMPRVVNVFLHASMDDCVKRIISRNESTDAVKAKKLAERTNKLRANYYNFYTDKKWGDAASYDLTFNTSILPLEHIADVIIHYLQLRFGSLPTLK